jgi:hypothetical protein
MVQKSSRLFALILLNIVIIGLFLNFNVKAQDGEETTYSVGFNEGTELIWEVKEVDALKFRELFGIDPNFERGDQIRIVIRAITEVTVSWRIDYEFWDYKTDWALPGQEIVANLWKNTETYGDYLFSLSPVEDYLAAVVENLPSEYDVSGSTINKRGQTDVGQDYRWEKEYDTRGVPIVETYYNADEEIVARVEGTFRIISFGFYFVGFMLIVMLGIIVVSVKRKNIRFN